MSQSRAESLTEIVIGVAIGYLVAIASQIIIFPFFGIHIAMSENLMIGAWFTLISIIRGYAVRRFFNRNAA